MHPLLFWPFTLLMLGFGCSVVLNRNPVASALSLVATFLCMAALFIGLDAYFIAIIEVLVYAGAVMVLFLFIIMLLDLKAEQRRHFNLFTLAGGAVVTVGFVAELAKVIANFPLGNRAFPALADTKLDDVHQVGMTLFSTHNLPFQVVGVLILVATIGVVILSRRELK